MQCQYQAPRLQQSIEYSSAQTKLQSPSFFCLQRVHLCFYGVVPAAVHIVCYYMLLQVHTSYAH